MGTRGAETCHGIPPREADGTPQHSLRFAQTNLQLYDCASSLTDGSGWFNLPDALLVLGLMMLAFALVRHSARRR